MHRDSSHRAGRAAALALILLAIATPMARAGEVEDGQRDFRAGRFEAAHAKWLEAAERGDAQAAFDLGLLFDLGRGVQRDATEALHWYRRAAEAGLPEAEFNVGSMYDSAWGTARDVSEAALWYARAAAHGDARAEYDLGLLYADGEGVPANRAVADGWFAAAAAKGLQAAADRLAAASEKGAPNGTPPPGDHPLATATLAAPTPDATVGLNAPDQPVELVWNAPPEQGPMRFYVEVVALDSGAPRPVLSQYLQTSATLVPGANLDGRRFAWRVFTVSTGARRYAAGPWWRFLIARDGRQSWARSHSLAAGATAGLP